MEEYEYTCGNINNKYIKINQDDRYKKPGYEISEGRHVYKKVLGDGKVVLKELRRIDEYECESMAKKSHGVSMFAEKTPKEKLACWTSTKFTFQNQSQLNKIKKEEGNLQNDCQMFDILNFYSVDLKSYEVEFIKEPFEYVYRNFFKRNI